MKTYKNQVFSGLIDRDSFELFQNILVENCTFENCQLSQTNSPDNRSTVRNVEIENCTIGLSCNTGCAVFENIEIDNLETKETLQIFGAVYKQINFRGEIGSLVINNEVDPSLPEAVISSFSKENAKYYETVDWALDISRGNFKDLEIWGIPTKLIIYDYKTQRVITRKKALEIDWKSLVFRNKKFRQSIEKFLQLGYNDMVMVAPRRSTKFEELLQDLDMLTEAGYTEPEERMSRD